MHPGPSGSKPRLVGACVPHHGAVSGASRASRGPGGPGGSGGSGETDGAAATDGSAQISIRQGELHLDLG